MSFQRYLRYMTGLSIYDFNVLSIGKKERKKAYKDLSTLIMEWILDEKPPQSEIDKIQSEINATFQDVA